MAKWSTQENKSELGAHRETRRPAQSAQIKTQNLVLKNSKVGISDTIKTTTLAKGTSDTYLKKLGKKKGSMPLNLAYVEKWYATDLTSHRPAGSNAAVTKTRPIS